MESVRNGRADGSMISLWGLVKVLSQGQQRVFVFLFFFGWPRVGEGSPGEKELDFFVPRGN